MSFGGRTFRAFRPSHYARQDEEVTEDLALTKQERIRLYAERVKAGLPLFDMDAAAGADLARDSDLTVG
jgi:hypothetical protein